jgi:hypothetical protein
MLKGKMKIEKITDNYDHPMFEEGIQLVDMVYLKKTVMLRTDNIKG